MNSRNTLCCSFCGKGQDGSRRLIAGIAVFICDECVTVCYNMVSKEKKKTKIQDKPPTPRNTYEILCKHVIGQDETKKTLSVAFYNHLKRIENEAGGIVKSNLLMIGPSGVGKTLIASTLAKEFDIPIVITDATSLTEAGYVGEDVESVLAKLLNITGQDVEKASKGIVYIDEIDKIAKKNNFPGVRDISGEGVQQALLKVMEGVIISVSPQGAKKHQQQDSVQLDTTNILFILGGAFYGLSKIIEKRIGKGAMGFKTPAIANGTEKLIGNYHTNISTEVAPVTTPSFGLPSQPILNNRQKAELRDKKAREMGELLSKVEVNDLVEYGFLHEFLGRVPIITTLAPLTEKEMVRILTEPENSIIAQYKKLFAIDNITLSFTDDAYQAIVDKATSEDHETGARGLRAIIEKILTPIMFETPSIPHLTEVIVNSEVVYGRAEAQYVYNQANIEHGIN